MEVDISEKKIPIKTNSAKNGHIGNGHIGKIPISPVR
jgi:hypothetical protein